MNFVTLLQQSLYQSLAYISCGPCNKYLHHYFWYSMIMNSTNFF
jgi:hypothetical protein